jgi:hypothetical protein
VTQAGALRWWMEPFHGSQIKVNSILLYKPNTLKGLHLSAMGNTHRENGGQKHVSNTQVFNPITMKNRQALSAIFLSVTIIIPCLVKRYIIND